MNKQIAISKLAAIVLSALLATTLSGMESVAAGKRKRAEAPAEASDETSQQKALQFVLKQRDSQGCTPLHKTVIADDVPNTRLLLKAGANVNTVDSTNKSALCHAARSKDTALVKLLVDQPDIDLNEPGQKAYTESSPLAEAIRHNKKRALKILLAAGAITHGDQISPLHTWYATQNTWHSIHSFPPDILNNGKIIKTLIKKRIEINRENRGGDTLLEILATTKKTKFKKIIKLLLKNGANIFHRNIKTGFSLLDRLYTKDPNKIRPYIEKEWRERLKISNLVLARHNVPKEIRDSICRHILEFTPLNVVKVWDNGPIKSVKQLLDGNFIPRQDSRGYPLLCYAVEKKKIDRVTLLLDRGADIEAKTQDGLTPLHVAAWSGKTDLVTFLIASKADIEAKTKNGLTPLHAAVNNGKIDVVTLLLDSKADIEAKNKDSWASLHIAVSTGNADIVKLLLDRGAGIDAKTRSNWTSLHLAAFYKKYNIVKLLLERGANVDIKNKDGLTVLDTANKRQDKELITLLERHKA